MKARLRSGFSFPLVLVHFALALGLSIPGCNCSEDDAPPSPTLSILAPLDGQVLGPADDLAPATPGLQLDVRVATTHLDADKTLNLAVSGRLEPIVAPVSASGVTTFANVTLPVGNSVSLVVTASGGLRAEVTVSVQLDEPTLSFVRPLQGDQLGAAADLDPALPGLQYDVVVEGHSVPDGTPVTLTWDPAGQPASETLRDGRVTFAGVTLPAGSAIPLVATAQLDALQLRAEVTIWVEEQQPTPGLAFVMPLQGTRLTAADDVDPALGGIQYNVVLAGQQLPAGQTVALTIAEQSPLEGTLGEDGRLTFAGLTLPCGDAVTLLATTTFADEELRDEVAIAVQCAALPPQITFIDPLDETAFEAADDANGDLLDGFQTDLTLQTANVENNQEVGLTIGGVSYPLQRSVVNGTATFEGVTLPEAPLALGGVELTATVANVAGVEASETIVVFVSTGACVVQLEPLPSGQGCDIVQDPVPLTPEVEATFLVRTNCDHVRLLHNEQVVGEAELDASQTEVSFPGIRLLQGDNLVRADATGVGGRRGESQPQHYDVQTTAPTLGLADLAGPGQEPTLFTLADDLYQNVDGLQLSLQGWVTGLAAEQALTLQVFGPDGQPLQDLPQPRVRNLTDDAGRLTFLLPTLTLPVSGEYRLLVSGTDRCGHPGLSVEYQVRVELDQPELAIVSPLTESVLLATDDADPLAPGFQTVFVVHAAGVPTGEAVEVRCGLRDRQSRSLVGSLQMPEAASGAADLPVAVTLPDGWLSCHAAYAGINPAVSEAITVLVAGQRPSIVFSSPRLSRVRTATVRVAVMTVNVEDGQAVTLTVNGLPVAQPMTVRGNGAALDGVLLQAGANTLHAAVADRAGNRAETTLTVVYDDLAPTVTLSSPTDGAALTDADDLDGDSTNGVQVEVAAEVLGVTDDEGATACLALGGTTLSPCPTAPLPVIGGQVVFPATRLLSGENLLQVTVRDGAGNTGVGTAAVELTTDAPRVTIALAGDTCLASGQDVRVEIHTDAADGAPAVLSINGLDEPEVPVQQGLAVFSVQLPADVSSTLEARVSPAGRYPGFSLPQQVVVRTQPGALSFLQPAEGAVVNRATPSTVSPGFALDVRLGVSGLDLGQPVALTVTCGQAPPRSYPAAVAVDGGELGVVIEDVLLPEEATCTLVASSTNCAGLTASAELSLLVDRVAPTASFIFPTDGAVLTFQNDIDPLVDGLQIDVRGRTTGLPLGHEVQLSVAGGDPLTTVVEANGLITFGGVTIPDGLDVSLRLSAADPAGNPVSVSLMLDEVIGAEPSLSFFTPSTDQKWGLAQDQDPSTAGFQADFTFVTANLRDGVEVRLCSNRHSGNGVFCGKAGYQVVASTVVADNRATVRRASLLEGAHQIYGEARYGVNRRAESGALGLTIDATAPSVALLSVSSDQAPFGVLNAAEDLVAGGATLEARVEAVFVDEPGNAFDGLADGTAVQLLTDNPVAGTSLAWTSVAGGRALFGNVHLIQGSHHLSLVARDAVGNPLPVGSPVISEEVDTTLPSVAFSRPTEGQVLTTLHDQSAATPGLQTDVELLVDGVEPGRPLTLTVNGTALDPLLARNGAVVAPGLTLADGLLTLDAVLTDAAGNPATATVHTLVDATPPQLTIISPTPAALFADGDDLQPGRGGFQIDVQLQVAGVPAGSAVQVLSSVNGGVVSDPAQTDAQGLATVRCTLPPGEQQLLALAVDEHGNPGMSAGTTIRVELVGCGVYFAAPTGSPVLLGRSADLDGDPGNGAQITVSVSVANLACNGLNLDLLRDGQPWQSVAIVDGQATFAALTLADGSQVNLQGRVLDGELSSYTETKVLQIDLTPPTASFLQPAASPATLSATADRDPQSDGLQYDFRLQLGGTENGTVVLSSDRDGELLRRPSAERPQPLGAGAIDLAATLTNGPHRLTATVADAAGNTVSTSVDLLVDVIAPLLGAVTPELLDARLPSIRLSWIAPGDDGDAGNPVTSYEVRYLPSPVTAQNFATACPLDVSAEPIVAAGLTQGVFASGPGPDGNCRLRLEGEYHFGIVAIDAVGNRSPLAMVGPVGVHLQVAEVVVESTAFGKYVSWVGDVNGDGLADLGVSSNDASDLKAWVVFGHRDLTQWTVQQLPSPTVPAPASFGYRIAGVGDVNGDGVGDVVVTSAGAAWLYFGQHGPLLAPALRFDVTPGALVTVAAAGNFDGEGPADLLITEYAALANKGAAWVVLGRSVAQWQGLGAAVTLGFDRAANDARSVLALEGTASASLGDYAVSLGNFCGGAQLDDGKDDVALSGYRFAGRGQVAILCGRTLAELPVGRNLRVTDDTRVIANPGAAGNFFGAWLAGGSDLRGDAHPDLVISATGSKTLYLYTGGGDGVPALQATLDGAGNNQFGKSVALPGDLDGEGHDDLVVTAQDSQRLPSGLAGIYLNDEQGFSVRDPELHGTEYKYGNSAAAPGDMDSNGDPDLAVGSPGSTRVYIYY